MLDRTEGEEKECLFDSIAQVADHSLLIPHFTLAMSEAGSRASTEVDLGYGMETKKTSMTLYPECPIVRLNLCYDMT